MSRSADAAGGGFSPLVMILVVLIGAVCLGGLAVLSAYAPELRSGDDGGQHALSRGATGFGALPRLLRDIGVPVEMSRSTSATDGEGLLVATPGAGASGSQVAALDHPGSILIVLPKWRTAPDPRRPGWVRTAGTHAPAASLAVLPEALATGSQLSESPGTAPIILRRPDGEAVGQPLAPAPLRTISGEEWIPVVVDAQGQAVLAMHRRQHVYVLADPDLISTHGLRTLAGAQTAVALLEVIRPGDAPVIFDLTLHGFQQSLSLPRLMLEPRLSGLTLVLLATGLFAALQAFVRFGPASPSDRVVPLGKRALADSTAGLIRLARREPRMAAPYARLIRQSAARAIGAPRGLGEAELDAMLDRVSASSGASHAYSALAESARDVRTSGDLVPFAMKLYNWKQELSREHR